MQRIDMSLQALGVSGRHSHRFQPCNALPALRSFAAGIQRDYDAVKAAASLGWSNGPVEGQVNRLKFIKRQMFGRANFDLLRRRVLYIW